ncbi:bifunctional 4-hydroxy-2-oxoglutarate aldolase/2-dehydro-3-deoxy-phosphogluconate aldolase [Protaetiibacter intestinalis]|nr:bifunctional 4-hydroxy-2-oxoglutarate aldolase/2-dehydro-3-deoxy-phosphogluconate aldolase [Protaetiibacter intestinalis]
MSTLERIGIVPVVVLDDPDAGPDLAAALAAGGIGCAEITLRTPAGIPAIARISAADPGFLVGAGTVLEPRQVDEVADAGARFVVSPGLDPEIVERALARGLEVLPGVATASEVQRALRLGLDRVKFFPAEVLGGRAAIEALSGPFPGMRFLPSGGVTAANAADYLATPAVFAVSGSWMVPRSDVAAGDWAAIEQLSVDTVRAAAVPR